MAAFKGKDDYDSDMSSEIEDEDMVSAWLDEEEAEPDPSQVVPKAIVIEQPKIDIVRKSKYIVENLDLFYALCEVDDWGFVNFSDEQQEDIMKALDVRNYQPGENVIVEGDGGGECYIVTATEDTADFGEVEVVNGNILAGTEVFLTRLHRGQYFGQKFFISRRANKRGATVRVPKDSPCPVNVAILRPEMFDRWESFRNLLLVKTVPMVQMLPRKERQTILKNLQIRDFKDGDYIIRQGEQGEEFYIIQEGSVRVTDRRPSPEFGWDKPYEHTLVTLREGHFFGEMALLSNEPRVASVIAAARLTICLCIAKSDFRAALSDETFNEVLSEVLNKRNTIRAQRDFVTSGGDDGTPNSHAQGSPSSNGTPHSLTSTPSKLRISTHRKRNNTSMSVNSGEVSVSTVLSMRKLESGSRVINKYVVERELGKGSYGDVYLCVDQETKASYAMKMINRPQSTWNDDSASSIRQEIAVMKRLQHNNIVNLHEVIDDTNARKIYLIQEFMEGGALMEDAETCDPVEPALARKYFRDILRGVCYLHSEGVVHRDIKPQNMLLASDGTVKIADFGAAVFTGAGEKVAFGGTPAFMAPELFLINSTIDFSKNEGIDVFALGATLYFMIVGRPPWMARNQLDLATKIKNIELTFPEGSIDPHLKHLLRQMLAKDYRTRCTLDHIAVDDWVTFEGSEPLFEDEDYTGSSFFELSQFAVEDEDGKMPYLVLIYNPVWVMRTMLSQKISLVHEAACACFGTKEDVFELMNSAIAFNSEKNFDFVIVECMPDNDGLEIIQEIRKMGFKGRIIATTHSEEEEVSPYVNDSAAHCLVRYPISKREITRMLAKEDEEAAQLHHTASGRMDLSQDDLERAITYHEGEIEPVTPSVSNKTITTYNSSDAGTLRTFSNDDEPDPMAEEIQTGLAREGDEDDDDSIDAIHDFQQPHNNQSSLDLMSGMDTAAKQQKFHLQQNDVKGSSFRSTISSESDGFSEDVTKLNVSGKSARSALSRKRGFIVVAHSQSSSNAGTPVSGINTQSRLLPDSPRAQFTHQSSVASETGLHGQFYRISVSSRDEKRRQKREAAMNRSKLAHQVRQTKKDSRQSMGSHSKDDGEEGAHSSHSVYALSEATRPVSLANSKRMSSRGGGGGSPSLGNPSVDREDIRGDAMAQLKSQGLSKGTLRLASTKGDRAAFGVRDNGENDSDDESDSDIGDIEEDSELDGGKGEDDSEDESDDDLGVVEDIHQLDGGAMDDMFDELIDNANKTKNEDENNDLLEWNHIMVSKGINDSLVAKPHGTNLDLELKIGQYDNIVSRSYMEDRTFVGVRQPGSGIDGLPFAFCAVFDGHNGSYAAELLKNQFGPTMTMLVRQSEARGDLTVPRMGSIFDEACALIDCEILRSDYLRQLHNLNQPDETHNIKEQVETFAGSAGVMMAVLPLLPTKESGSGKSLRSPNGRGSSRRGSAKSASSSATPSISSNSSGEGEAAAAVAAEAASKSGFHVFIAHVGDCRAVLCNDGMAVALTEDHKAGIKSEKARIEAAGGWVHNNRVNGALGVSRSFGDIQFKVFDETPGMMNGKEDLYGSIWGPQNHVISKPDFKHFEVESHFEFIIMASDGLWDVFDCQEAVNFVRKKLAENRDVDKTAQDLIQKAIKRGTQDNTSCVISVFHQTKMPAM